MFGNVVLVALLCSSIVKSDTLVFTKEPGDEQVKLGSSKSLDCKVNETVVQCSWLRNRELINSNENYKYTKDSKNGDCTMRITKFAVKDATKWQCLVNGASGPNSSRVAVLTTKLSPLISISINKLPATVKSMYFVNPDQTYEVDLLLKNGYPPLEKTGSLEIFRDGVLIIPEVKLVSPTDIPEANSLEANFKFLVEKTTTVKWKVFHSGFTSGSLEQAIILKTDGPNLDYRAIARPINVPATFSVIGESDTNLRDVMYYWYQQKEGTTQWDDMAITKNKLDLNNLPLGNYTYKVAVAQTKLINIRRESEPIHLLVFDPITTVAISNVSSDGWSVSTKAGSLITLECKANGYPEPEYHWIKATEEDLIIVRTAQNLTLGKSSEDSGRYKCAAEQSLFQQRVFRETKEVVTLTVT